MMPSAQQVTMKPKLAFSIESIVGKNNRLRNSSPGNYCDKKDDEKIDANEYLHLINRAKNLSSPSNNLEQEYDKIIVRKKTLSESSDKQHNDNNNDSFSKNNNNDSDSKNIRKQQHSRSPTPVKQQTFISGLIRPIVVPPHAQYPDATPHPHFLAQFQAAAALANVQAVQSGFSSYHLPPHLHNTNMPRESYPLYPWLLSRHGRIFPHRFPGNFLLQPFRKPKRVRTAFSPSQLLKLEHAFEGNHYVVGSERKTLAQQLSLSETQVKVWFQNRRTKFKRTQQEEGDSKSGNKSSGSPKNFDDEDENDDEMIDIGDECPTTDDEEMMLVDNGA
ncbi:hypothetical protein PVAND_002990 [Polypedilum vanderplanki]|uniref:Homeobox domain-containing protein n=1 Tax=Polypedilum vanderplanki TaxID=319348 RepID=A0A9J6BUD1_POLVA|nr:hypothetical protein PVAND_002990 [Polypedilum vanderplanki]